MEDLPEEVSSIENDKDTSTLILGNSLRVHVSKARVVGYNSFDWLASAVNAP